MQLSVYESMKIQINYSQMDEEFPEQTFKRQKAQIRTT